MTLMVSKSAKRFDLMESKYHERFPEWNGEKRRSANTGEQSNRSENSLKGSVMTENLGWGCKILGEENWSISAE